MEKRAAVRDSSVIVAGIWARGPEPLWGCGRSVGDLVIDPEDQDVGFDGGTEDGHKS